MDFFAIRKPFSSNPLLKILVILFAVAWIYFCLTTRSQLNWWIENILVLLFIPWFIRLHKTFLFNNFSLLCLFLFLLIHIYGAQMSYTYNQLGIWLKDTYHLERNPYDRFVHFNFGFLVTYPLYDFATHHYQVPKRFSFLIVTTCILGLATWFELIEWLVAATTDSETGETYVATQGDVWDAHKDIALAYIASILVMFAIRFKTK